MSPARLHLAIDGMSCDHCVRAVTRAITETPGARPLSVRKGAADVEVDTLATTASLLAALADAGYPAHVVPAGRPTP